MERWVGRVAVVTGASAGIGAAIAYQLQDAGLIVVALARRVDKIPVAIERARNEAKERGRGQIGKASTPGKLHSVKCDVSKEEEILSTFKWIKEKVGRIDILVNNAGVGPVVSLGDGDASQWKRILDLNVLGLSICTREAIKLMREKGIDDGHVVHIGSIAGHNMPYSEFSGFAMYHASKHAVRVLTEGLRKELVAAKSKIRVTEVSPGGVSTEFLEASNGPEFVKAFNLTREQMMSGPILMSEDIADAVLYALSVPPHVQIHEMIVKPVGEQL